MHRKAVRSYLTFVIGMLICTVAAAPAPDVALPKNTAGQYMAEYLLACDEGNETKNRSARMKNCIARATAESKMCVTSMDKILFPA